MPHPGLDILRVTRAVALAAVLATAAAGAAQAQTCTAAGDATTVCRLTLSQPRVFTVRGSFKPLDKTQPASRLSLSINGRPCASPRYGLFLSHDVTCRVDLPAGPTSIQASGAGPGRIRVAVVANGRLASLPREVAGLDPRRSFWSMLWPFRIGD